MIVCLLFVRIDKVTTDRCHVQQGIDESRRSDGSDFSPQGNSKRDLAEG